MDSSKDYIDAMVKAVVGLEIDMTRLLGKSTLNQDKEVRDFTAPAIHSRSKLIN